MRFTRRKKRDASHGAPRSFVRAKCALSQDDNGLRWCAGAVDLWPLRPRERNVRKKKKARLVAAPSDFLNIYSLLPVYQFGIGKVDIGRDNILSRAACG